MDVNLLHSNHAFIHSHIQVNLLDVLKTVVYLVNVRKNGTCKTANVFCCM